MPAAKLPRPLRKDPKPRHLDGSAVWSRLVDRKDDRHYVYVNKGDPDALATYEAAGYDVEVLKEGGVRPAGGRTCQIGAPIEMRGLVLHSCSMERKRQIELEGIDGDSGQLEADRIEEHIVDRRGFDPLRGMHNRIGVSVRNEIERPENEVGA